MGGSIPRRPAAPFVFRWVQEAAPGPQWLELFQRTWPSYKRWFRRAEVEHPDLEACAVALATHMPELLPTWQRLQELTQGDPEVARMLSLFEPTPYVTGCSQAIWTRDEPLLVRNYDYHRHGCEGLFLHSNWSGTRTLVASDCLWGVLDGVNDHGLVVSLAFGGRREVGSGFGIPLILRYVLETCASVDQAIQVFERVPSHMSYNISLLQASGEHALVAVAPDRSTSTLERDVATNHQPGRKWSRYDVFTRSAEREKHLQKLLADPSLKRADLLQAFLEAPLYNTRYERAFGTIYTSAYDPVQLQASFLWPGMRVDQGLDDFSPGTRSIDLGGHN